MPNANMKARPEDYGDWDGIVSDDEPYTLLHHHDASDDENWGGALSVDQGMLILPGAVDRYGQQRHVVDPLLDMNLSCPGTASVPTDLDSLPASVLLGSTARNDASGLVARDQPPRITTAAWWTSHVKQYHIVAIVAAAAIICLVGLPLHLLATHESASLQATVHRLEAQHAALTRDMQALLQAQHAKQQPVPSTPISTPPRSTTWSFDPNEHATAWDDDTSGSFWFEKKPKKSQPDNLNSCMREASRSMQHHAQRFGKTLQVAQQQAWHGLQDWTAAVVDSVQAHVHNHPTHQHRHNILSERVQAAKRRLNAFVQQFSSAALGAAIAGLAAMVLLVDVSLDYWFFNDRSNSATTKSSRSDESGK